MTPPATPEPSPLALSDFDFDLPPERIALRPAEPRDSAWLMQVDVSGGLGDHRVRDLPNLLAPGDVLVFNDTRVIPARLSGLRERAGSHVRVEATLHRRLAPDRWTAFMRPGKRLQRRRPGRRSRHQGRGRRSMPPCWTPRARAGEVDA